MEEHNRSTGAAGVPIPKMRAGKLGAALLGRSLRWYRHGDQWVVELNHRIVLVHRQSDL